MQVEQRKVADLVPYANNARTHDDAQVAQIAASIKEFGWTNPILVDGVNGVIAGHGRLLAARKLGLESVPVIELSHLSDTQRRAYILADNKLALNAGWDEELLRLEIESLQDLGVDLELTGFSEADLSTLFLEFEQGETDALAEWEGMPEFKQEDKTAFRSIHVHFACQSHVDEFAALIEQKITDKTRMVWFPFIEIETYADKSYE